MDEPRTVPAASAPDAESLKDRIAEKAAAAEQYQPLNPKTIGRTIPHEAVDPGVDLPGVGHVLPEEPFADSAVYPSNPYDAQRAMEASSERVQRLRTEERLLIRLLFAARSLAQAQIVVSTSGSEYCLECRTYLPREFREGHLILAGHRSRCDTGRVLQILAELDATLPGRHSTGEEEPGSATEPTMAPRAGKPAGSPARFCARCCRSDTAWIAELAVTPLAPLALHQCAEYWPSSTMARVYTHLCDEGGAA